MIVHEWRTPNPILQVRLITNRSFAVPTVLLIILTFTAYGMQILNPVFLQELLGYTAWKAGLAMAPRGMGVMAAMFLLGGLARKGYDTRALVYLGYILIGIAQWELSTLDLTMSISNFVWPTVVQGIGMGLIFPTLAGAALSSVSRENMGYAASFFSMVRNIGASVGTSTLTTYLTHLEQTRQSYLVNHVTVFDAWQLGETGPRLPGAMRFDYMHQLVTGQKQGLAMIYGEVQRQAMMLSLNDIYRALCYLMVVAVIITAFLPRSRVQGGAAAAH